MGRRVRRCTASQSEPILSPLSCFRRTNCSEPHLRPQDLGPPLLVTEICDNGNLCDLIMNDTFELEPDLIMSILHDVVKGMRFLHAAVPAIVHGDLRSSKVFIDSSMKAKIADYGLSQKRRWSAPYTLNATV